MKVVSHNKNKLIEKLLQCQEELENYRNDLQSWTDSFEELTEIEDAFEVDKKGRLHGKTILDIGTDCVKPLYIALKFEPEKIIGISEHFPCSNALDTEHPKPLMRTEIKLYNCSCFNEERLGKILTKEKQITSDFVLLSKTLHHLRTGECVAKERDEKHRCREDEESCIYKFEEHKIFKFLLQLGKRVIIYEYFYPHDKDDDKERGRGGYFTIKEWRRILSHLSENYRVEFIEPLRCHLNEKELNSVIAKLKQVDYICFYAEIRQEK